MLFTSAIEHTERGLPLFIECMLQCTRKVLDIVSIVREAMFQQQPGWRQASVYFLTYVSVAADSGSALGQVSSLQQNVVGYLERPVTRMRNIDVLVPILMLAMCHVAASQSSAPAGSKAPARSALKLKSVELDNKYTIQIPDYFTVHQISDRIAAAPTYSFSAAQPHYTTIQVFVLPYSSVIPINENTGLFKLPIGVNGSPFLTAYFKIRENQYAYYGWSVTDQAYECTMNSACPHPTPRKSRYMTQYAFAVFDKPNNSVVEFTEIHFGPSKKVTGFQGDGKLLRDVIVPSLTSIH